MKHTMRLVVVVVALMSAATLVAQTPEASILPVTEPLDVGGTILQPGDYLIRVLPSSADRNKVQITSMDRSTIYATVLTVPHTLEPGEEIPNTTFVFYPAGEGMPRALRTWFAPNPEASLGGHDIVYEESRARQLARLANARVTSYPATTPVADLDTTELEVVTAEPALPPVVPSESVPAPEPAEEPMPMVSSARDTTEDTVETPAMPETASRLPLLALLALVSLAGAFAVRVVRT